MANVSKKTVSRVINDSPFVKEETRLKINTIIRELGFAPDPQARGLAFRRSFLIGMIYDNPTAQYVVNMQQGILDAMRGTSFELVIRPCDRSLATFLPDMRHFIERQKLFGVVLTPSVSEDDRFVRLLQEIDCPYVRIASVPLDTPATMVVTHDFSGAADAARHLADLGHELIAHISGPASFRSSHERRRGFTEGLAERGLKLRRTYDREAGYTFDSGMAAAQELLSLNPRPTAIFAGNDEMAAGVYKAARNLGLAIPGDLSVVGFDDSPVASRMWPLLTSVRLPIRDMGRMAAEKLFHKRTERRARNDDVTEVIPTLVIRESSARPPVA
ncbi:MAG: LacI family DNA-binding transcriptional regulator [Alphaproteobacteria bacterium]|nr:LacI family DNA-binding transcriptional regulator [Alphaproteobacteria bacterium]MDE2630805.1 LacI family DNA-binding transcriptional regulator [Alphaproteobacteria bacterium]